MRKKLENFVAFLIEIDVMTKGRGVKRMAAVGCLTGMGAGDNLTARAMTQKGLARKRH